MAETPQSQLVFTGGCPDCGERRIELPSPLPDVGDDFDWRVRDYDGFRLFMMEELAARFPERQRWTPADLEVALVEVLATVLDQLSDMADRVASEATLATARRPDSVRRLLALLGYDAVAEALADGLIADPEAAPAEAPVLPLASQLESLWQRQPHLMEAARAAGPRSVHTQHRMVTATDYARRLEDHPLVLRAHARHLWSGSWNSVWIAIIGWNDHQLDEQGLQIPSELQAAVDRFHERRQLAPVDWQTDPTLRSLLRPFLDAYRMAGQEVILEDAAPVPVTMALSLRVAPHYFRSEIRQAVTEALGTGPGGFFEPGRLSFGEDLHLGDLVQVIMTLDGVEHVCFNRFKRLGSQFPDRAALGRIPLQDLEIAVCDNDAVRPERGYTRLTLQGGRPG
ncbi:MAG: hypothetical protein AAF560_12830 [Acidobacteriota bacterium]